MLKLSEGLCQSRKERDQNQLRLRRKRLRWTDNEAKKFSYINAWRQEEPISRNFHISIVSKRRNRIDARCAAGGKISCGAASS
jgi:hypothetical protein